MHQLVASPIADARFWAVFHGSLVCRSVSLWDIGRSTGSAKTPNLAARGKLLRIGIAALVKDSLLRCTYMVCRGLRPSRPLFFGLTAAPLPPPTCRRLPPDYFLFPTRGYPGIGHFSQTSFTKKKIVGRTVRLSFSADTLGGTGIGQGAIAPTTGPLSRPLALEARRTSSSPWAALKMAKTTNIATVGKKRAGECRRF